MSVHRQVDWWSLCLVSTKSSGADTGNSDTAQACLLRFLNSPISFWCRVQIRNWDEWCNKVCRFSRLMQKHLKTLKRDLCEISTAHCPFFTPLGAAVKEGQSASIPIWDLILLKRFPVAGNPVKVAGAGGRHLTRHFPQVLAACVPPVADQPPGGSSLIGVPNWLDREG